MKQLIIFAILIVQSVCVFAQSREDLLGSYNFKRGQELLFGNTPDLSGALDCFKKELQEHPNNGYALYCMGLIYDDNSQAGKTLDCLNRAVPLLKKDKGWISFAYRLRAKVNLKLGNAELAEKDWKESLTQLAAYVNVTS